MRGDLPTATVAQCTSNCATSVRVEGIPLDILALRRMLRMQASERVAAVENPQSSPFASRTRQPPYRKWMYSLPTVRLATLRDHLFPPVSARSSHLHPTSGAKGRRDTHSLDTESFAFNLPPSGVSWSHEVLGLSFRCLAPGIFRVKGAAFHTLLQQSDTPLGCDSETPSFCFWACEVGRFPPAPSLS